MDDYELFPAFPFSDLLAVLFKYCSLQMLTYAQDAPYVVCL